MANQLDHCGGQIQTEHQIKIVKFSGSKIVNLGILSMIIVLSLFVTLLWPSPELYYIFFGAFVLSPIVVLGMAKVKSVKSNSYSFSLSKVFLIAILGIFVYLNVFGIKDSFTLILAGFFINSFSLTVWTLMPFSTSIKRQITKENINLVVMHHRLFIGTSITNISIKKGEKVTLKPNRASRIIFSRSFVFHHLHF